MFSPLHDKHRDTLTVLALGFLDHFEIFTRESNKPVGLVYNTARILTLHVEFQYFHESLHFAGKCKCKCKCTCL